MMDRRRNLDLAWVRIADVAVLGMPSAKLARFKLPKRAVFTDVIPRTPTGKALKRLLREQFPVDAPE